MPLDIIDLPPDPVFELQKDPLPREFGLDLSTVARARQWLTNPHNWHDGNIFILRWDGLVPTVNRTHGMRLVEEPWDDGLPLVVVMEQRRLRQGGRREDEGQGEDEG